MNPNRSFLIKNSIQTQIVSLLLAVIAALSFSTAHASFNKIIGECNISLPADAHPVIVRMIYTYLALNNVPADDPKQRRFQIERLQMNLENQLTPIDFGKNKLPLLIEMNYTLNATNAQLVTKYPTAMQYDMSIDLSSLTPDANNPRSLQGLGTYSVPDENDGKPQTMSCNRLAPDFFPPKAK